MSNCAASICNPTHTEVSLSSCTGADCIRHDYASLAENAYPEAYSEFKHSMLLLIFDEDLQTSPVKYDWSLQTRAELAGMLCRTLRQTAGHAPMHHPLLLCLLSYIVFGIPNWSTNLQCSISDCWPFVD